MERTWRAGRLKCLPSDVGGCLLPGGTPDKRSGISTQQTRYQDAAPGTNLGVDLTMMKRTQPPTSHRIVRWIFQKGNELVTCGVVQETGRPSFTLSLVSTAKEDHGIVEVFESGVMALQRHARVAAHLRELGWTVVAYTCGDPSYRIAAA